MTRLIAALVAAFLCLAPVSAQDGMTYIAPVIVGRDLGVKCGSYFYFGDTFSSAPTANGPSFEGHRANTGAASDDTDYSNGLSLSLLAGDAQLLPTAPDARATTPNSCIIINNVFHLHYMDVWTNSGHDFELVGSGIATSTDGVTWAKHRLWDGETSMGQAALVVAGDYAYALGTEGGRLTPAILGRVTPARILDPQAWEYFDGVAWGDLAHAQPVIRDSVGEMSVCWNDYLGAWMVVYMSPNLNGIVMRTAPMLEGTWSDAAMLLTWQGNTYGTYAPQLLTCGQTVYMLVSRWQWYTVHLWAFEV